MQGFSLPSPKVGGGAGGGGCLRGVRLVPFGIISLFSKTKLLPEIVFLRKVNLMSPNITSGSQMASDALLCFATQVEKLPEPYFITGPQAGYIYHRWLQPIYKMIEICIPPEKVMSWQEILPSSWTVLSQPPTLTQMRRAGSKNPSLCDWCF